MTTTVATRRSVLSGLAVSALALAAMASFILISVSGGAGAQNRATGLDDLAVPACTDNCTDAEVVIFSPHSSLSTADPDEDEGYQFYGTGADDIEYDGIVDLASPGPVDGRIAADGESDRELDLSVATGRLYTTVVNESDAAMIDQDERPQNAIVPGSDIFGIAVYDPDAAIPETVTINDMSIGNRLGTSGPQRFDGITPAIVGNLNVGAQGSFVIGANTEVGGKLILPIRDEGASGSAGDLRFWEGDPSDGNEITRNVNFGVSRRGVPNTDLTEAANALINYTVLISVADLHVTWRTASGENFVVVEVDGNATGSAERLYLRLNETARGTDLYVGEVQLFSAETQRNRDAYLDLVSQSGTQTVSTVLVADDDGDMVHVIGQAGAVVRAPFIADARDNITVRFRDKTGVTGDNDAPQTSNRSATIIVETDAPTITVTAPEHEFATSERQIDFTGTASDADSGLDVTELRLGIANPQTAGTDPDPVFDLVNDINPRGYFSFTSDHNARVDDTVRRVLTGTENEANGLYRDGTDYEDGASVVDWRYTPDSDEPLAGMIMDDDDLDNDITFSLVAVDLAGNVGFSDSEDGNVGMDANNFRDDFDAFTITLDGEPPALRDEDDLSFTGEIRYENSDVVVYGASQTGILWDPGESDLVVARNAIAVVFDGTVEPPALSSFTVEWDDDFSAVLQRVVPSPSNVDADDLDTGMPNRASLSNRNSVAQQLENTVFLVFDEEIPSSQTPRINVSDVMDPAGNRIASNANVVAEDGLGPDVSVTLTGGTGAGSDDDRQGPGTLTRDEITIEIQVNEQGPNPRVSFYSADGSQTYAERQRSRPSGENRWRFLFQSRIARDGVVCVVVTAEDNAQNGTTEGVRGSSGENCNRNSDAVYFTLDTSEPDFDPPTYEHRRVFVQRPNIQIPLDAPVDPEEPINLRIDGEEIEDPNLRTSDNQLFFYQPAEPLTFGTHMVGIQASDLAGNRISGFETFEIRISERDDFELSLDSGWNLISFPSDPEGDARVSAVFSDSNVLAVSTFDAANFRAGNQMATRNPLTGSFSGNLSEVSTGLAYWVFADEGGADVSVRLQGPSDGSQSVVPTAVTIPTVGGVNLVGVVDPSRDKTQGDAGVIVTRGTTNVTVGEYLDNVSQSRVQTFDSRAGIFVDVDDSDEVTTGMGLVVYINPDITGRTPEIIP